MRILITSNRLAGPGGAQSFVRVLGRGLERLGHSVLVYSSSPGNGKCLLENDMVPTTSNLENLPFRPDVIHCQHHLDAMTAIMSLPEVPALYHCHGAGWRDSAPKHPRIYHYLAMSRTLGERMTTESNIAPTDITVFLNGVDVTRFASVRTPQARPVRALVYQRAHGDDSDTNTAIREAAIRTGIELDHIGARYGKTIDDPERVLPTYDIVFASGISAIEALACGCAVVVLGRTSCGEMISLENFDRFRQVNFSIAVNSPPPSADKIEAELRRYSPNACAGVTARIRREANLTSSLQELVKIYEHVIERHRCAEPGQCAESIAASRYLRKLAPMIKVADEFMAGGRLPATTRS